MPSKLRIIVTGLIAQHPTLGGVTWDYLQYALGLAQLGHDVYYFEDSGEWPYNLDGGPMGDDWVARDPTPNVEHLRRVMTRFGLAGRWAYRYPVRPEWFGLSDFKRSELLKSADLLINVSGTIERPDEYRAVPRLAYIDSDPVFTQVRLARGEEEFRRRVDAHDVHFSFGECFSESVPVTGHDWRPTRTPIVLSEWWPAPPPRDVFTTVMSWTSYRPLVYGGETYGQKDVEFRRFLELPSRAGPEVLEVALGKTHHVNWESGDDGLPPAVAALVREHPDWTARELLGATGWRVSDASQVGGDLDSYRRYVQESKAEWSVAKNGYVRGQAGWFSCRSACYLAAGRPVVVQDTGFAAAIPTGRGILAFRTLDEAVMAIRDVTANYEMHALAARDIAAEYFAAEKVLGRLIDEAIGGPVSRTRAAEPTDVASLQSA
jgi:hypothetical protein